MASSVDIVRSVHRSSVDVMVSCDMIGPSLSLHASCDLAVMGKQGRGYNAHTAVAAAAVEST